jgi:hypothetical protein
MWVPIWLIEIAELFVIWISTSDYLNSSNEGSMTCSKAEADIVWGAVILQFIQIFSVTICCCIDLIEGTKYLEGFLSLLNIIECVMILILAVNCGEPKDVVEVTLTCVFLFLAPALTMNVLFKRLRGLNHEGKPSEWFALYPNPSSSI